METKPWWKSKTMILNGLTAVTAVAVALSQQQIIQEYPKATAAVAATIAGLNMAIRVVTYLPLG